MKKILKFTIPLWLGMIVNTLLGITDFYFLGQIDFTYLTVVGIAYIPFSLLSAITIGIGIETNRTLAKGNKFNFKSVVLFVLGFTLMIAIFANSISDKLFFFANNHILYSEIVDYFNALIFLIVPTSIIYICTGILRGRGIPEKSVKFSILAVILNFVFDFIFIKMDILGSSLKGCAYASIVSDVFVVCLYLYYLNKKCYLESDGKYVDTIKFFKNAWAYSVEKLCSSSTVVLISSLYISKIAVEYSSVYYGIDRFFTPILMFSYCYFEWVIYAESKNISYNKKRLRFSYGILLFIIGVGVSLYLGLDRNGMMYTMIYIIYCMMFLIEREIVAKRFAFELGKSTNRIILFKSISMICVFHIIWMTENLSLVSIGLVQVGLIMIEILFMKKAKLESKVGVEEQRLA